MKPPIMRMINKARRKFIIWAMIAMAVIVVVLVAAVNIVNWNMTDRNLSATIMELAEVKSSEAPEVREKGAGDFVLPDTQGKYEEQRPTGTSEQFQDGTSNANIRTGRFSLQISE